MKLLGLLLVAGFLTGCAAVDTSDPIETTQSQPVEVATDSPPEVTEESETETDAEEAETSMLEPETEPEESAPATTQSVQPSATKAPPATQKAEPVETQAPEQTPAPEPEPEPVESKYSMANIAKNDSTSSCWAAITGKAYDLTAWISRHPGGAGAIVSICGTDATSVFQGKHGGQSGPASSLSAYLLGDVDS
jgi:cytochrome b involved in lipid metabolism